MLTTTGNSGGDLVFIVFQMFTKGFLYWVVNGTLLTKQHNPAVTQVMLVKIKALGTQGKSFSEIIDVPRPTTVPQGNTLHVSGGKVCNDNVFYIPPCNYYWFGIQAFLKIFQTN